MVVWDPRVSVTVYKESAQLITCGIFIQAENISFTVYFAYGFNLPAQRLSLWEELHVLNSTTLVHCHPWAVLGDFNQILKSSHHSGHLSGEVDITGMKDFNIALQDASLFQEHTKGLIYSWWNKREANPTCKRIDHALINEHWSLSFPDAFSELLEPCQSDHTHILFQVPSL